MRVSMAAQRIASRPAVDESSRRGSGEKRGRSCAERRPRKTNGASDARFGGSAGSEQTIADVGPHGYHIPGSRGSRGLAEQDVYPVRTGRGETFLGLVQPEREPGAAFLKQVPRRRRPQAGAAMYAAFVLIVRAVRIPGQVHQKRRDRICRRSCRTDIRYRLDFQTWKQSLQAFLVERVDVAPWRVFLAAQLAGCPGDSQNLPVGRAEEEIVRG